MQARIVPCTVQTGQGVAPGWQVVLAVHAGRLALASEEHAGSCSPASRRRHYAELCQVQVRAASELGTPAGRDPSTEVPRLPPLFPRPAPVASSESPAVAFQRACNGRLGIT